MISGFRITAALQVWGLRQCYDRATNKTYDFLPCKEISGEPKWFGPHQKLKLTLDCDKKTLSYQLRLEKFDQKQI